MAVIPSWRMKLWVAAENAFNVGPGTGATQGIFAATDAIHVMDCDPGPEQKQRTRHRKDRNGTRSMSLALVHGASDPVDAEITLSFAPSGTAGTAPDTDVLLENAYGLGTNTPATSEAYTIAANPSDSLAAIYADTSKSMAIYLFGAVVTQRKITIGEEEPVDSFSLQATRRASIMQDSLNGGIDNAVTTITVTNPRRFANAHGCVIIIESEEILLPAAQSSFNYSTGAITGCTRGHNSTSAAAHSDAVAVYPSVPASSTTAGAPIGEYQVTASFGGTSWSITGGEITFDTGRGFRPMERDGQWVQGLVNRQLSVSATLDGVLDTGTDSDLPGDAVQNTSGAVSVVIGGTAGSIDTIALAAAEITVATEPVSEEDPVMASIEFMGYGSSGNDDASETYT